MGGKVERIEELRGIISDDLLSRIRKAAEDISNQELRDIFIGYVREVAPRGETPLSVMMKQIEVLIEREMVTIDYLKRVRSFALSN